MPGLVDINWADEESGPGEEALRVVDLCLGHCHTVAIAMPKSSGALQVSATSFFFLGGGALPLLPLMPVLRTFTKPRIKFF